MDCESRVALMTNNAAFHSGAFIFMTLQSFGRGSINFITARFTRDFSSEKDTFSDLHVGGNSLKVNHCGC